MSTVSNPYDIEYQLIQPTDWQDAVMVQDACNISGITLDLAALILKLRQEADRQGLSWVWVDHHPIIFLFAYKIYALTGNEPLADGDQWLDWYRFAKRKAGIS